MDYKLFIDSKSDINYENYRVIIEKLCNVKLTIIYVKDDKVIAHSTSPN
jgi:hypothetical protein